MFRIKLLRCHPSIFQIQHHLQIAQNLLLTLPCYQLYISHLSVDILELMMDTEVSETCFPNSNCVVFLKCLIFILLLRKFGNIHNYLKS